MQAKKRAALAASVLALSLIWRAVICFSVAPAWEKSRGMAVAPDSYTHLAESLLDKNVLGYGRYGATPTSVRGPGFPLWLAGGMVVGGEGLGWLRFWSSLPGALGAALLAWVLAGRYGAVAASVGGLLAGLHPIPVLGSARLLGDEFYGVLGLAASVGLAEAFSGKDRRKAFSRTLLVFGLVMLTAHLLTRSSALLTWFALFAVFVGRGPHPLAGNDGRRRWPSRKTVALLLLVALLPAGIWSWRTSRLEGRPVYMHSLTAFNFWIGQAHHVNGFATTWEETRRRELELVFKHADLESRRILSFSHAQLEPKEVAALEERLQDKAIDYVIHHPLQYLNRCLHGLYRFWIAAQTKPWPLAYLLPIAVFVSLAIGGSIRVLRGRGAPDRLAVLLLSTTALHNLAYAAVLPTAKMSAQVYPSAAYLAGIGAMALGERVAAVARRRRGP